MSETNAFLVTVTREIPASAQKIFSVLARPSVHTEFDGSGMVKSALDDVVLSRVGDVFSVNMFNDDMGDYVMENHVVEFEVDVCIVWEPVMQSITNQKYADAIGDSALQLWGYRLESLNENLTKVTEFFDCSRSPEWLQTAVLGGERWRPDIEVSLDKLAKIVTTA